MKKYESILSRVDQIEEKYGIKYAKPTGKLFKGIRVFYTLAWIYTLGINLLCFLGYLLHLSINRQNIDVQSVHNGLWLIGICTGLLIVGFVLMCTRLKWLGLGISVPPVPFLAVYFAQELKDDFGFMGLKPGYYWKHFAPLALMFLLLMWMLIIYVRYVYKRNSQYKRVTENLYNTYHSAIDDESSEITEEQWEHFLENYDPRVRDYKKQFALQSGDEEKTESEEDTK